MAVSTDADVEAIAQLDGRDVAALTEPMDVYADDPETTDDQVAVYNHGQRYIVTPHVPCCDCPDMIHRRPARGCKHIRRYRFATGQRTIPAGVDRSALDDGLGADR
ncbi:hypothetical protein NDI56_03870 [Haloarcula sp. S1CR25-12]|uniref:SWIM-type domain-containing protein n=1 Tax=Haloarcula saliterrae TaxID=2950534 RepID=A0ABU2F8E8_9EURY|nr:hypothetical protein [Haloarcula sp. S1CR25-12]MDS0258548.1 hypothetical protein [Haloarcula sp. S1CR25-12]